MSILLCFKIVVQFIIICNQEDYEVVCCCYCWTAFIRSQFQSRVLLTTFLTIIANS